MWAPPHVCLPSPRAAPPSLGSFCQKGLPPPPPVSSDGQAVRWVAVGGRPETENRRSKSSDRSDFSQRRKPMFMPTNMGWDPRRPRICQCGLHCACEVGKGTTTIKHKVTRCLSYRLTELRPGLADPEGGFHRRVVPAWDVGKSNDGQRGHCSRPRQSTSRRSVIQGGGGARCIVSADSVRATAWQMFHIIPCCRQRGSSQGSGLGRGSTSNARGVWAPPPQLPAPPIRNGADTGHSDRACCIGVWEFGLQRALQGGGCVYICIYVYFFTIHIFVHFQ